MSLFQRLHETQTQPIFIDPTAARGPKYGPPEPGPLYGPPEPAETDHKTHRIRSLAMTALGGYAMYKSAEGLTTPASEVIQFAVLPATLAVTGLRSQVTEARLRGARRKSHRGSERAFKTQKRATELQKSFDRIMNGTDVPYETSIADMEKQSPIDKLDQAARKVKHPSRQSKPSDSHAANRGWRHDRAVRKMVSKRNKRRKYEYEEEAQHRWFSKTRAYDPALRTLPLSKSSALDTEMGWQRLFQTPRTGLEVRGYRRAIERSHHEAHKAHKLTEKTHKKVEKVGAKARKYDAQHTQKREKISRLGLHKSAIENREDKVSKYYDNLKTTPAAYREGRVGVNVPDTLKQRVLNKAARGAGLAIGTVKREYKPSNMKRGVQRDMESIRAWRARKVAEKAAGGASKQERKTTKKREKAERRAENEGGVV